MRFVAKLRLHQIRAPLEYQRQGCAQESEQCMAGLYMLYNVYYNSMHCLYCELPSASH